MSAWGTAAAAQNSDEDRTSRRTTALAVASVLVPPAAWLLSLGGSYVLEDFTCTAAASAAMAAPSRGLFVLLVALNAVLILATLLAGAGGWIAARHGSKVPRGRLVRFLGGVGAVLSLMMTYGIVLIGAQLLFLEVCG